MRGDAAFRRVRARGRAGRHPLLTLRWLPGRTQAVTVGIVASKKVGNAVTRNRVRRRVREAVRRQDWPACEVMLVMTPESARASYQQLLVALNLAAAKSGLRQAR
ncbi:MAG TPA: ribonuclease P protein component [Deinococcales bacterium]|nr:ribonuclease P protein component [Deinococcales bacterium]